MTSLVKLADYIGQKITVYVNDKDEIVAVKEVLSELIEGTYEDLADEYKLDDVKDVATNFFENGDYVNDTTTPASVTGSMVLAVEKSGKTVKIGICSHCEKILGVIDNEGTPARDATYREGELIEIPVDYSTTSKSAASTIKHKPTTVEEFNIIAKKRGYKLNHKGVCYWAVEQALEYATSYDDCLHIAKFAGYEKGWAWYQWQDIKPHNNNKNCASLVDGARRLG